MAALNEAYDLSLFEPQEETVQPKLKVTETQALRNTNAIPIHGMFLATLAIIAVVSMVYSQVKISEISAQINTSKAQLEVLENQNRVLNTQLESSVSLRAVEQQATRQYGMSEAEDYQVEYVVLSAGDSIQVNQAEKDNLLNKIIEKVRGFMEYIGLR